VVTLKQPNVVFGASAATRLLVPRHVHEQLGEKAYKQQPVGTGPYKLKEFKPAEYGLLEANADYRQGRPWIDFWRQDVVPEPSVRAIALQTHQADSSTWALTPEDTLRLLDDADRWARTLSPIEILRQIGSPFADTIDPTDHQATAHAA